MKKIFLFLALLSSACVHVPDVPICVDQGVTGWCTWTISDKEQIVNETDSLLDGKPWSEVKTKSLLVPADSWAKIKAYILKKCNQNNDCKKDIKEFEAELNTI